MKYIALLRGINVSGKNKIVMSKLRSVLEDSGLNNVVTFINSGNVIFDSDIDDKKNLTQKLCETIEQNFHINIPVYVTTKAELEEVINNSPSWWDTGDKNIYSNLILITSPFKADEIFDTIGEPTKNIDRVEEFKNHIFWSFDLKNYRKSNWWKKIASSSIKDKITIRTSNTLKKVLEISEKNNF